MRNLFLSLLLCLLTFHIWACAYDESMYYGGHLFGSELLSDSMYKTYYDLEPYCDECFDRASKTNLMEWKQKLGTTASLEEIEATVYTKSLAELREAYNMSAPRNEFERALFKNKDLVEYLLFAKQIEPLCLLEYEEWGEAPVRNPGDVATISTHIDSLQKIIPTVKDQWLRQRYVMQLVRLSHFAARYADAIQFYDKYVEPSFAKNSVFYRTLSYKGGAFRRNKELIKAKFTFAQVFDQSPDFRHIAYKNFKYIDLDEAGWKELVAYSKTPSEQACVWLMQEVYMGNLNLDNLRQVFTNDPGSARLEVVALRQINRLEESILLPARQNLAPLDSTLLTYGGEETWEFGDAAPAEERGWWSRFWNSIANFFRRLFGMEEVAANDTPPVLGADFNDSYVSDESKSIKESKTMKDAVALFGEISKSDKLKNKALFQLLNAYVLMNVEEYSKASDLIAEVKPQVTGDLLEQAQFLETLLTIWKNNEVNADVQTVVLEWLKKAENNKRDYANDDLRKNYLLAELGRKYLMNNQFDQAALAFNYSYDYEYSAAALLDWYYSDGDLVRLSDWLTKGPEDELSKFLVKKFYSPTDIIDVRATKMMRKGKFKEAKDLYALLPDTFKFGSCSIETNFEANPIVLNPPINSYTRKQFADEALKRIESKNPDQLVELANGMSFSNYWCYNGTLWKCGGLLNQLNSSDQGGYPLNVAGMAENFHNRKMAFVVQYATDYAQMKYYKQAADLYPDNENKAKALFYALQGHPSKYVSYYHKKATDGSYDDIQQRLHGELASTRFVQDMMVSCPDFAAYKQQ